MSDSPAGRPPPPPFAVELIERGLRNEAERGLEAAVARLIAATLIADDRPAISEFARSGRITDPLPRELAEIRRTFRPTYLAALRRFVAAAITSAADDHSPHLKGGDPDEPRT